MTTASDSVELTRVGPGTVMGQLMREYWIPALMSSEVARGGAPLRLMLLGEKLIAFRDSEGRVGVMDHRCPHRCASLFLGRNEGNGLRCIYHGWKFDVAGTLHRYAERAAAAGLQAQGQRQGVPRGRTRRRGLGLYGRRAPRRRRCRVSRCSTFPTTRSGSSSSSATAIICRRWRATSTPRISASCTPAMSMPTILPTTIRSSTRSRSARRTITSPTPPGARPMRAIAPPARAAPPGASAISCFRSGRRCRTASSPVICRCAAGCRSTMSTPCTACCGGSAAYRR